MNAPLSSDQKLNVGDVGIIVGYKYHRENLGREAVVVAPLGWYTSKQERTKVRSYKVEIDGESFLVPPEYIRKKRPPSEDRQLVRWSECPWQPAQVRT